MADHRRTSLGFALALASMSGSADAAPRLSPALGFVAAGRMDASGLPRAPSGRLQLFVHYDGPVADLLGAGLSVHTCGGGWCTAEGDLSHLSSSQLDGAELYEAHVMRTQLLDRSVPLTGAVAARHAQPQVDGRNVVVGIIDTGIDFTHADFRREDGSTRVRYVEDFSAGNGPLHGTLATSTGVSVWSAADLDRAIAARDEDVPMSPPVTERDIIGHGTHVTGIIAGSGRATGAGLAAGRYVGMAPGADIIAVKANRSNTDAFSDADIVDGVSFVYQRAEALGEPAVVNLSIGSQSSAHAGLAPMERVLSALIGADKPGRVLVAAAGNDGAADLHASGSLGSRPINDVTVVVPDYNGDPGLMYGLSWEVWTPMEGALTVVVMSPGGTQYGPVVRGVAADWDTPEGHLFVDDSRLDERTMAGRHGIYFAVQSSTARLPPASGTWHVYLSGKTPRYDMWITANTLPVAVALRGGLDPDGHLTIPATADDIIAVGSFGSKRQWTSFMGTFVNRLLGVGQSSPFSGSGPTADGRFKPDLIAPGEFIASSLSADALPDEPTSAFLTQLQTLWADDGVHGLLRGTSMAAPHVSGAVALLLQMQPTLTAPDVRELLRASARTDPDVGLGAAWGPRIGFGKLAVDLAARLLQGERGKTMDPNVSAVGVARDHLAPGGAETATVTVIPKDADGLPLGSGHRVEITSDAGTWDDEVTTASEWGRYTRTLRSGKAGAVAQITVRVDDAVLNRAPRVWFAESRADIGRPPSGGCSMAAPGRHASMGNIAFLVAAVAVARGRRASRKRAA
jgi:subtilisin family serine protease